MDLNWIFNICDHIVYDTVYESFNCPKCKGSGIYPDLQINNNDIVLVEKKNKLIQDLYSILTTQLGNNPFERLYGTTLGEFVGETITGNIIIRLQQAVLESIEQLRMLQEDAIKQGINISPEEKIKSINKINLYQDNKRILYIEVEVITEKNENININYTVKQ